MCVLHLDECPSRVLRSRPLLAVDVGVAVVAVRVAGVVPTVEATIVELGIRLGLGISAALAAIQCSMDNSQLWREGPTFESLPDEVIAAVVRVRVRIAGIGIITGIVELRISLGLGISAALAARQEFCIKNVRTLLQSRGILPDEPVSAVCVGIISGVRVGIT